MPVVRFTLPLSASQGCQTSLPVPVASDVQGLRPSSSPSRSVGSPAGSYEGCLVMRVQRRAQHVSAGCRNRHTPGRLAAEHGAARAAHAGPPMPGLPVVTSRRMLWGATRAACSAHATAASGRAEAGCAWRSGRMRCARLQRRMTCRHARGVWKKRAHGQRDLGTHSRTPQPRSNPAPALPRAAQVSARPHGLDAQVEAAVQGGLARSLSVGLGLSSRLSGISLRRTLSSFRRARAPRRAGVAVRRARPRVAARPGPAAWGYPCGSFHT